jgi:MarR family transcriptional regulator, organic hydroperoxide resistance regulator
MVDQQSTIIEEIIEEHRSILRAIGASAPSVWMELDLSMAQLKTLMTLYTGGPAPIGQIAEYLGVGQPTASHLVDRLVQTQLVLRMEDPLDRRRTLAQLSPGGEELAERINQVRFGTLRRWLAQLDDAMLEAFLQSSRALAAVARAETTPISETT